MPGTFYTAPGTPPRSTDEVRYDKTLQLEEADPRGLDAWGWLFTLLPQ